MTLVTTYKCVPVLKNSQYKIRKQGTSVAAGYSPHERKLKKLINDSIKAKKQYSNLELPAILLILWQSVGNIQLDSCFRSVILFIYSVFNLSFLVHNILIKFRQHRVIQLAGLLVENRQTFQNPCVKMFASKEAFM